ncbi:putative B3 domain-containing protein Os03g0621600 isoform X2 [Carica papaya]|uniref:putative B3 domain-containing protein Os03g0621600 isoform X2 n=1 Tax=Carica papaya TaxID=3649 RepID=UPI000B8CE7CE|nr:putative B3 domain-containing protein Os03g0621600 isoform X2 [Carica papaya]
MVGDIGKKPSFFKVLIGDFSTQLQIPPAFVKYVNSVVPQNFQLCNPDGICFPVVVERVEGNLYFKNGWRKFVQDNSLELGDFLVFLYVGNSRFDVELYGRDCCQKEISMSTRRHPKPLSCNETRNIDKAASGSRPREKRYGESMLTYERKRHENATQEHASNLDSSPVVKFSNSKKRIVDLDSPLAEGDTQAEAKITNVVSIDSDGSGDDLNGTPNSKNQEPLCQIAPVVTSNVLGQASPAFKSEYPRFQVVMRSAYVRNGYLHIPLGFKHHSWVRDKESIMLRVSNKLWPIKKSFYSNKLCW